MIISPNWATLLPASDGMLLEAADKVAAARSCQWEEN